VNLYILEYVNVYLIFQSLDYIDAFNFTQNHFVVSYIPSYQLSEPFAYLSKVSSRVV